MSLNSFTLNSAVLNGAEAGDVLASGSGPIIIVEQIILIRGSGSIIDVEQIIQLKINGAGSIIDVEQIVQAVGSGAIINVEQTVENNVPVTHFSRTGWDMTIVVDGRIIPTSEIHGAVSITRTEDGAAIAEFMLIPPTGIQNIDAFTGKTVTIDCRVASGNHRVYTGVVDIPLVDFYEKKIRFQCTDKRKELINNQLGSVVATIGYHSDLIFPHTGDIADQVSERLTTVPFAVDFDPFGNYHLTAWAAKSTADFTLNDADIYEFFNNVEVASRGRIINKIDINMEYRFQRNHNLQRTYTWQSPIESNISLMLAEGYSLTRRDLIRGAIQSAGWPLNGDITFTDIHPSGWYRIGGVTIGWSTVQIKTSSVAATDSTGAQITDGNGNVIYTTGAANTTDYSDIYCNGAQWAATTRWAQTVTEAYAITVQAPQSQTQYGTISGELKYGITADFDSSDWEDYEAYTDENQQSTTYFIDRDVNRNEFNNAVTTAQNKAKTTILKSHRDTRASFKRFIWPEIDLRHTVDVSTTELATKGKVYSVQHIFDHSSTEAFTITTLALSRVQGSQSEDTFSVPTFSTDTTGLNTSNVSLGNHFGVDPSAASAVNWNGMVGNKWETVWTSGFTTDTRKTQYPEHFIVDTPPVPSNTRDERLRSTTASFNIEIPNDTLTVTF